MSSVRRCSNICRIAALILAGILCLFMLAGCGAGQAQQTSASEGTAASASLNETKAETQSLLPPEIGLQKAIPEEESHLKLTIDGTEIPVLWEDNESVAALEALVQETPLTIQMSAYGGFEQVGPIGQSIPRNDVQIVTDPGDIVLYSGNQIVVFYGSNRWDYTRLGRIQRLDQAALEELLGGGAVTLTLSAS